MHWSYFWSQLRPRFWPLKTWLDIKMASVLASVTDAEVAKTATSFLAKKALSSCLHDGFSCCNSNKSLDLGLIGLIFFYQNYLLYWFQRSKNQKYQHWSFFLLLLLLVFFLLFSSFVRGFDIPILIRIPRAIWSLRLLGLWFGLFDFTVLDSFI